ncbi:hypothetical protein BKA67DRAFT_664784 [Truncatella angustata]|uniref:Uncharacterized protein n=1 Tax=Truncatella angustata TaxID=152316 RepID=A0A9P8UBH3_9PEZI|nr:uncharacterized protein BKA67DRAFT_664784 [Truncatella angustata]KAH6644930.1 hypothetical protein BKA67DRAFT_664784 [Truncatella angustata]KAH8204244.1 hypothetical protein TruAng_001530 [Truncatella angustata]
MPYPMHYIEKLATKFKREVDHVEAVVDRIEAVHHCNNEERIDIEDAASSASERNAIYNPAQRPQQPTPKTKDNSARHDLVSTHQNLTQISQYLLKLEVRTNKVSKIHVRKTLDATIENAQYSREDAGSCNHQLIRDIECLSSDVWGRLHHLDREFRRLGRENRDADGQSTSFQLNGESFVKKWIAQEIDRNAQRGDETCWYTVKDMNNNRSLLEWTNYLKEIYDQDSHLPMDENRIVQLSWHFLDRRIRPPRPEPSMSIAGFINQWHDLREIGAFELAAADHGNQRRDDEDALKILQTMWSAKLVI